MSVLKRLPTDLYKRPTVLWTSQKQEVHQRATIKQLRAIQIKIKMRWIDRAWEREGKTLVKLPVCPISAFVCLCLCQVQNYLKQLIFILFRVVFSWLLLLSISLAQTDDHRAIPLYLPLLMKVSQNCSHKLIKKNHKRPNDSKFIQLIACWGLHNVKIY